MVQCFAPDCNHRSERETCRFFRFPDGEKDKTLLQKWITLIRRDDKEPNRFSRLCSCHFRDGKKKNGPEIFVRNKDKLFPKQERPSKRQKISPKKTPVITPEPSLIIARAEILLLQHSLNEANQQINLLNNELSYFRKVYSVDNVDETVLRMETGLPSLEVFNVLLKYVERFQSDIIYYQGWSVETTTLKLKDQLFLTLMKLRQNYSNVHLGQLFGCSRTTIANIIMTFISLLHSLLFEDLLQRFCPTRFKNQTAAPNSFINFLNCRMIIDCTDFKIMIPKAMDKQKVTYSSYRSLNSFKALVGVSPNGVINFVSKLYPGSISDKVIFKNCGVLSLFTSGDLILADKGFLIHDCIPHGVTVNIPPFLMTTQFTEKEASWTKELTSCRIQVERASQRLKEFKILSLIPHLLRSKADVVLQLVACIVNLQLPLNKECAEKISELI